MGKKALIKELEAALEVVLEDYRTECTKRIAAELESNIMAGTANMFHRDVKRLTEERDELRLELAGMTSDAALDAAMADIETLTQANEEADATIGELRDDLADMRERLDAALTEAARMRKEWTGDVTAAREVIERKSAEIVELRRDVAAAQRERDAALGNWQNTESLLQELERELDTLQAQHAEVSDLLDAMRAGQAQAAPAEPVVTLEAIEELEEGERLIDDDSMIVIEMSNFVYWIYGTDESVSGIPAETPQRALELYQDIKRGVKP